MTYLAIAFVAILAAAPVQIAPPENSGRDAAYAIYSKLLFPRSPGYVSDEGKRALAIAPTTRPAMGTGTPCIVPPSSYDVRWTEVLADFETRKNRPVTLERRFQISQPYAFVNANELQQGDEIITLSDVYFSNDRTLALTGISTYCGSLCASAQWKIYEKARDGAWVEVRPERNCQMVA